MKKIIFILIALSFICYKNANAINVNEFKNVQSFIQKMHKKHGFSIAQLEAIFSQVNFREIVIKKMQKPAEKMTWAKYQKIFITENRINKGVQFIGKNKALLDKVSNEFGLPIEIITAVIGIETNYGENKGSHLAIEALASLAFQPNRRQKFFLSELENLFLMSREENISIFELKGSYAGALGIAQFIPSSYRHFAIDYDGDNSRDLIYSLADAAGSIGNYFSAHHWKTGSPIAERIYTPIEEKYIANSIAKPRISLLRWEERGVKVSPEDKKIKGKIISFMGEDGAENWMVYDNFYVITRYNQSKLYAMAVFQLSEKIKEAYQKILEI